VWKTKFMPKILKEKLHIYEKYQELVWALSSQGYNNEEIGGIFNRSRSQISRVVNSMPKGWKTKWKKIKD